MSRLLLAAAAALSFLLSSVAWPQNEVIQPPTDAAVIAAATTSESVESPQRAIDSNDLSAYADGLIDAAMEREGIAGVTVAIVDRHGPLLLRGYGIAALSPQRPVDPQDTLFRIASISKTFTYLLGLKLIDAGQLDLDQPVNSYLPQALHLPDDGYPPVLLRHLFTHTAGFEDSAIGHIFYDRSERVPSAEDYLRDHRPKRVREPGTMAVYSNYSVALLGALIAHVVGTDFSTLAERELFQPLAMPDTTFREPFAAGDARHAAGHLLGRWSEGFKRGSGSFSTQAFEHANHGAPSGAASSTAADMGRYLRMLLNDGELDGVRVLSTSAHEKLLSPPLFRNAPEVGGFAYGFFQGRLGEVITLGHGGATFWFHSALLIAPELDVGIFISTNTNTGRRFAADFPRRILERYFPQARATAASATPAGFDAARFAGNYNAKRSNYSRSERPFTLNTVKVTATDDHSLILTAGGESSRWVPESERVFRAAEGQGRIVFFADATGRIQGYANALGHNVFERAGPFATLDAFGIVLALAGITALLVVVGAWLRRRKRDPAGPHARSAARWLYFTALTWLVYVAAFGWYLRAALADTVAVHYAWPGPLLPVLLWAWPVLVLVTAIAVLQLGTVLRRARAWGFWRRLRHLAAVAIFALTCWLLWHWNLVGWKL